MTLKTQIAILNFIQVTSAGTLDNEMVDLQDQVFKC